jgi:hypothetical protein
MAMNPNDLMALLASGQQVDPRLEAIRAAMSKRVTSPNMMPMQSAPATDSGIGDYVGEAVNTMTPRGQQPNYNNTGTDPYVKFPAGGVDAPYRMDSDMHPEPPNFDNRLYADATPSGVADMDPPTGKGYYPGERGYMSDESPAMREYDAGVRYRGVNDPEAGAASYKAPIATGEGSYERQPGEDQAQNMVEKAVEGKGTTYPKTDDASGDEVMYDEAYAAVEPDGVHGRGSHPDPDNWEDNHAAFVKKYGMTPEEFLDEDK